MAGVRYSTGIADTEVNKLTSLARERRYSWEEWRRARAGTEHAAERFAEIVRRELGLPDVDVLLCYPPRTVTRSPRRTSR
jgi:hypothetical protein